MRHDDELFVVRGERNSRSELNSNYTKLMISSLKRAWMQIKQIMAEVGKSFLVCGLLKRRWTEKYFPCWASTRSVASKFPHFPLFCISIRRASLCCDFYHFNFSNMRKRCVGGVYTAIGWSGNFSTNERAAGKLFKENVMKIMQNPFVVFLTFLVFSMTENKLRKTLLQRLVVRPRNER